MIRGERGITLTELLVALAITGLIIGTLVTAIFQIFDITGRGNSELVVQHDLQNAATWLNRDVLSASEAEVIGSRMVLTIPTSITDTINITYTYSEVDGTLTRDSGGSASIIARYVYSDPFPSLPEPIEAPNVVTVTLHSRKGDFPPGSGTFALKMRPGESIATTRLCQVTGAESLGFDGSTVSWVITNTGQTSPSIDEIYITWPSDDNGELTLIDLDASTIWDGLHDSPAPISGPWQPGSREVYSGTQTLEFSFLSNALADEAQYSITITLTDKCTFPFPPNP